jgi:hypothetical protein
MNAEKESRNRKTENIKAETCRLKPVSNPKLETQNLELDPSTLNLSADHVGVIATK